MFMSEVACETCQWNPLMELAGGILSGDVSTGGAMIRIDVLPEVKDQIAH